MTTWGRGHECLLSRRLFSRTKSNQGDLNNTWGRTKDLEPLWHALPSLSLFFSLTFSRAAIDRFHGVNCAVSKCPRDEWSALHVNESACHHAGAPQTRTTLTWGRFCPASLFYLSLFLLTSLSLVLSSAAECQCRAMFIINILINRWNAHWCLFVFVTAIYYTLPSNIKPSTAKPGLLRVVF